MKKFIINILIFFGIVAVVDVTVGKVFWYLQSSKAGGRTGAEYYACKESNEDIIIMGSSRASHHYVPNLFEDSLGMTCINAGQDGNGIIMQYGRWKMISERYSPKLIIYDITSFYDLDENDNMIYIDRLKPFCSDKMVKNYVSSIFPLERVKLNSQLYRYNYKFLEMTFDCLKGKGDGNRGYFPLYGQIRREAISKTKNWKSITIDNQKVHFLEQLAKECNEKDTKLVFVVSPTFNRISNFDEYLVPVQEIADKYGVQFFSYYDSEFSSHQELFKDSQHLNDEGAKAYTSEIISRIKI